MPSGLLLRSSLSGSGRTSLNWSQTPNWSQLQQLKRRKERAWRKRVGVEPTIRPAKDRIASFEGRESHRTLFASVSSIVERFPVSQGKIRCDGTPLRRLVGCGLTQQRDRKEQD